MIGSLLRFCRGFVRLEVRGAALENFLNLCRAEQIEIWETAHPEPDRLTLTMARADWKRMEKIHHRTMCTARVVRSRGLLRALRPFLFRPFLIGTALLAIFLSLLSTRFLWRIRIDGCVTIPQREIFSQLQGLGLELGAPVSRIDGEQIRRKLMTLREDLSYVTINLRGTEAHVTVTEKDMTRRKSPPFGPCDIYADKAGIIEELQVLAGVPRVKTGDTVLPGDLLVSGVVTSSQGETRLVESRANITLRTWREAAVALPAEVCAVDPDGETHTRWSLQLGQRRFLLPCIEKKPPSWYSKHIETIPFSLGEGYFFPLTLIRERWQPIAPREIDLSEELCGDLLRETCKNILESRCLPGGFRETGFTLEFSEDRIVGTMTAECLERTGVQAAITP